MGVGMNADRGNLELAAQSPAIQSLDILEFVKKTQLARIELIVGQRVKHEGIVRIGTMADGNQAFGHDGPCSPNQARRVARPESSKGVHACNTPFEDSGRATQYSRQRPNAVILGSRPKLSRIL